MSYRPAEWLTGRLVKPTGSAGTIPQRWSQGFSILDEMRPFAQFQRHLCQLIISNPLHLQIDRRIGCLVIRLLRIPV